MLRLEKLDRDRASQAPVASLVHCAHPAGPDRRKNFVGPKLGAWCVGHRKRRVYSTGSVPSPLGGNPGCWVTCPESTSESSRTPASPSTTAARRHAKAPSLRPRLHS